MDTVEAYKKRSFIFKSELEKIKSCKYIDEDTYLKVKESYVKYEETYTKHLSTSLNKNIKSKPIKPPLTAEQIRENNITWVLILGVLFLLIGGMVLATNTWDIISNVAKVALISLVCVLFYSISIFTSKVLKIEKTAFAFLTLAGLFIPISIFSAGYYKLFGDWLSISGDGKYILGIIGATICLLIYMRYALKSNSKIFIWLGLISLLFDISFIVSSFHVEDDKYYLGMMVFNTFMVYLYNKLKNDHKYAEVLKELPKFIQINVALFTFMLILTYSPSYIYGIDIIISSVIYLNMLMITSRKEYSYVFSALLIYGSYMFVHSTFVSLELFQFAIIGFAFISLAKAFEKDKYLYKVFNIISAIVSTGVLLLALYRSIYESPGQGSIILLITFILVFINVWYLSYITKLRAFVIVTPLFLMFVGYQDFLLTRKYIQGDTYGLHMYIFAVCIYLLLFYYSNNKYIKHIAKSSGITAFCFMYISIFATYLNHDWILMLLQCIGVSIILYFQIKKENKEFNIKTYLYIMLFNIHLALTAITSILENHLQLMNFEYKMIMVSILIIGIWHYMNKKWKDRIVWYLVPYAILGELVLLASPKYPNVDFVISIFFMTWVLYILYKSKLEIVNIIPLSLIIVALCNKVDEMSLYSSNKIIPITMLVTFCLVFKFTGDVLSKELYKCNLSYGVKELYNEVKDIYIDWYTVSSIFMVQIINSYTISLSIFYRILPDIILIYILFSQVKRVSHNMVKQIIFSLAFASILIPYYRILGQYVYVRFFDSLFYLAPWIALVIILKKKIWTDKENIMNKIEWVVLTIVSCVLLVQTIDYNQLTYGVILGVLAIISIMCGMNLKIKSYFFVGSGTLIVNLFIQKLQFWSNLPWWIYLIFSGFALIGIASFNEWQKKNHKQTIKQTLNKFKDWK